MFTGVAVSITALVDNPVGRLIEDRILQGGVDTSLITWRPFDGLGRQGRNGINFTERGFGVRAAIGMSDRSNSAASAPAACEIDWDGLSADRGVRWLHTGGIYAALSEAAAATAATAMQAARQHSTIVSYDLNHRASLWEQFGGRQRAQKVNRQLVQHADVVFGNEEDFDAALGFKVAGVDGNYTHLPAEAFRTMIIAAAAEFPNWAVVATTPRVAHTATTNDWGAIVWARGEFAEARHHARLQILDRVGDGDSFASGVIYALLASLDEHAAAEYGAAHGALAMTTPGDTSTATLKEVTALVQGRAARIIR